MTAQKAFVPMTTINEAVRALPDSPDEIAQYLAKKQIWAEHSKPSSQTCPLARYFQQATKDESIRVGYCSVIGGTGLGAYIERLPESAQTFIRWFDKGKYDEILRRRNWIWRFFNGRS